MNFYTFFCKCISGLKNFTGISFPFFLRPHAEILFSRILYLIPYQGIFDIAVHYTENRIHSWVKALRSRQNAYICICTQICIWIREASFRPCVNFIKINTIYSAISQFMPHVRSRLTPLTICINLASQLEEGRGRLARKCYMCKQQINNIWLL